jgi:hypothetical protein
MITSMMSDKTTCGDLSQRTKILARTENGRLEESYGDLIRFID